MPAAGLLLVSSNISLLPLCFCFASCNVSRETITLTLVGLTRFSAKKKRATITPFQNEESIPVFKNVGKLVV